MEDSADRWLQLAEMALDGEESRALWSGDMEKSCCGCEETPLGLLRMLITCKHREEDFQYVVSIQQFGTEQDISTPKSQITMTPALIIHDSNFS